MPRQNFDDGMELLDTDLDKIPQQHEREMYDRILYEFMQRTTDGVFGVSFLVSRASATSVSIAAGNGFQTDNTQVSPEPIRRPLYAAAATVVNITAAHASLNRIDLVCIKHGRAVTATGTRNYKGLLDDTITPTVFDTETDWASTFLVVAGTPAGSPAVPSTPVGYLALAQVVVTAVTGIAVSNAFTDVRVALPTASLPYRGALGGDAFTPVAYPLVLDATYDGATIFVTTTAARTITMMAVTPAKFKFTIIDVTGTANIYPITIARNGSGNIQGLAADYVCEASFGMWTFFSNGTETRLA